MEENQQSIAEANALPASLGPNEIILGERGGERRGIEGRGVVFQIPGTNVTIRLREFYHQINSGHFYRGYLGDSNIPSLAVKCIYLYHYFSQNARDIDNEILIRNYFQSRNQNPFDNHVILPEYVLTNASQIELVDQFEKYFFIISPLANVGDIFDLLDRRELDEDDFKQLFRQMVMVIKYLQDNNIFHRDLKPDNFAVNNDQVYVIDFGKASIENENTFISLDNRYGTAIYSAPELNTLFFDGQNRVIDWRKADVWALGVSLFSMLMEENPPWVLQGEVANPLDPIFQCICRERRLHEFIALNAEDFEEISTDAIDLLQQMLIENPDERITINGILNHAWLAGIR